jgi:hypothetical protein
VIAFPIFYHSNDDNIVVSQKFSSQNNAHDHDQATSGSHPHYDLRPSFHDFKGDEAGAIN